ncbi:NAD(P)-binding domain-containing protein [Roseococcus thiosulfatophilus]|uniref:NAD(P)-binding domain-containing protein n=1 Tax=Roseococcus thiosulfatophilus TaxID=35813 RepID=UPI001A8F251B
MIGLVGLGRMGGAMLGRLRDQGQDVAAFDQDAGLRARAGGVSGLADCAAPVVILSLPHEAAVEAVLATLLPAMPRAGVVVDTSTIAPGAARRFAEQAAARGVGYLDAPVSGGPAGAAAGTLAMMLGGEEAAIAAARPVLERLATRITHVGGPGAGQVAKLANNLLVATHLMAAAEALRMADAAGVKPEALLPVLNAASGRSAATEVNWPRWILPGGFDSGFAAGLMRKDVRLALELAEAAGTKLPVCGAAAALWEASPVPDSEEFNRVPAALFEDRSHG